MNISQIFEMIRNRKNNVIVEENENDKELVTPIKNNEIERKINEIFYDKSKYECYINGKKVIK